MAGEESTLALLLPKIGLNLSAVLIAIIFSRCTSLINFFAWVLTSRCKTRALDRRDERGSDGNRAEFVGIGKDVGWLKGEFDVVEGGKQVCFLVDMPLLIFLFVVRLTDSNPIHDNVYTTAIAIDLILSFNIKSYWKFIFSSAAPPATHAKNYHFVCLVTRDGFPRTSLRL